MNRIFERALFVNVILLMFFILTDFYVWNHFSFDLNELRYVENPVIQTIRTNYYTFFKVLTISGMERNYTGLIISDFSVSATNLNVCLLWMLVVIAVNLYFVWDLTKQKKVQQ